MSFQQNLPPSLSHRLAKTEEVANEPMKRSKEDYRQLKELEEARKAGTAPAMKDEEGNDINPHIPQYVMQAPWYYGSLVPTLKHQRVQADSIKEEADMQQWYKRGKAKDILQTKFRPGACTNCGAMTHKKKDCLERPRKVGAKFTGQDLANDEFVQPQLQFSYEGKRDRWNGYDASEHSRVVEEFAKIEEAKRALKAKKFEAALQSGETDAIKDEAKRDSDDEDEDKYADNVDMPGQKFETKQRITVRNLRIREDTAKYLYNLRTDSAHYDPKTRSMRGNPLEGSGKEDSLLSAKYAGDNFVRYSGDSKDFAKQQMFAWEAYEKGANVNLQADPTRVALLNKDFDERQENLKTSSKQTVLDKYGGQEHLEAPPKQMLMAQTEDYVEYSRHGTVIKGQEKAVAKSKYLEDVLINNHSTVWGSYWSEGRWGYKCCKNLHRNSYCTSGAAGGSEPVGETQLQLLQRPPSEPEVEEKLEKKKKKKNKKHKKRSKKKAKKKSSSDSDDSDDSESDEDRKRKRKLTQALEREAAHRARVDCEMKLDERQRNYNVTYNSKGPTEEEVEAWKMMREREEDPMLQFKKK